MIPFERELVRELLPLVDDQTRKLVGTIYAIYGTSMESAYRAALKAIDKALGIDDPPLPKERILVQHLRTKWLGLGNPHGTLRHWQSLGWVTIHRAGQNVLVDAEEIARLLRWPGSWIGWRIDQVIDPGLRVWAEKCREAQPWQWIDTSEAGRRKGCHPTSIRKAIHAGELNGASYQRSWNVRTDDAFEKWQVGNPGWNRTAHQGVEIKLPVETYAAIKEYGDGQLSRGIKRLWAEHEKRAARYGRDRLTYFAEREFK